jgi:hypothetical protein
VAGHRLDQQAGSVASAGRVGFSGSQGIGTPHLAVLGTELGADSIQSLGLERVENKVLLGGEVMVQPAQAQMSGTCSLPHCESSAPCRSRSGATAMKISCWRLRRSSGGRPGFPDMTPSFSEQCPQQLPRIRTSRERISQETTGHGGTAPSVSEAAHQPHLERRRAPMSHPNEVLLNTYFKAAESGDLEILGEVFADNISAHIVGDHTLSGDYQGKEAVFGFFGKLAERSGGTARLNLRKALTDDWFAVALVELAGRVGVRRSMVNGQCSCCASSTAGSSSSGATTTTSRK